MNPYTLHQAESGATAPKEYIIEEMQFNGIGLVYRYQAKISLVYAIDTNQEKVFLYQSSFIYGRDYENTRHHNKSNKSWWGKEAGWLLFEARYLCSIGKHFKRIEELKSYGKINLPPRGGSVDAFAVSLGY